METPVDKYHNQIINLLDLTPSQFSIIIKIYEDAKNTEREYFESCFEDGFHNKYF